MKVLVLNTDMTLMGTTKWQDAICMIVRNRAVSVADTDIKVHDSFFIPVAIRLLNTVRHLWRKSVPWSKQNIHTRDNCTCQYCSTKLERRQLTIDHVVPKDQGGKNSWTNTVTACFSCNNKKDNRTPSQAKMSLRKQPYQPTIMEFVQLKIKQEGLDKLLTELDIFS